MTLRRYLEITGLGLLFAAGMGLLSAGQLVFATMAQKDPYTFTHALIMQTPFWVFWAPVFPLILVLVARFPIERENMRRDVVVHIAAAVLISLLHLAVRTWFMHSIGHGYPRGHTFLPHFQESVRYRLWVHLFAYFAMLGAVLAVDYYRKARERLVLASQLEAQLADARLHALRMQLHPHFLFNALNSIAMLTRRNENTRAVRMLAGLGDLLRYLLEESPADEVTVREEVGFIERYLEIERVRFGDRLRVHVDIQESVQDAFIPNLLLQPLVENAVKHGIARMPHAGSITITGARVGERVVMEVSNDGPGLDAGLRQERGVGLHNTRTRLEQLYGADASLDVVSVDNGVRATIWLPFRTAPQLVANVAS